MKVKDVMTTDPTCCTPGCSLENVARLMRARDCGAIPIVGDLETKYPIGIVTDRDIVIGAVARGANIALTTVSESMSTPAFTLTEDADLDDCIELLEERQIRRVIIVDRTGRCVGIVSQADIATCTSRRTAGELLHEVSKPAGVSLAAH